ncbi:uncharacterized protein METZ01_LOCUS334939, partial [marine metagenome]
AGRRPGFRTPTATPPSTSTGTMPRLFARGSANTNARAACSPPMRATACRPRVSGSPRLAKRSQPTAVISARNSAAKVLTTPARSARFRATRLACTTSGATCGSGAPLGQARRELAASCAAAAGATTPPGCSPPTANSSSPPRSPPRITASAVFLSSSSPPSHT